MPTTREVLEATIALERRSMALYARLAKAFAGNPRVHDFCFDLARAAARHVGALDLVSAVLELEGVLDRHSPVTLEEATVAKLDAILRRGVEAARSGIDIEQALGLALEVEETELEDKVGDLLKALQQHDEYERCMRLLVHDLGELSYMIEQYCQDPAMLQRCDELVNHHAETLRRSAVR
jgi:hypothetical protein